MVFQYILTFDNKRYKCRTRAASEKRAEWNARYLLVNKLAQNLAQRRTLSKRMDMELRMTKVENADRFDKAEGILI